MKIKIELVRGAWKWWKEKRKIHRWHTAEKFYRSENASIFTCLLTSKKMICLDANQGIFPLPCKNVGITAKCTQIITTISILAADTIFTPRLYRSSIVATYTMIDKCENKRVCSRAHTCICSCFVAGIVEHKSLEKNKLLHPIVWGFGIWFWHRQQEPTLRRWVWERERFGYIWTEMTNSAKTLMGGQSTLDTFHSIFVWLFTHDSIYKIGTSSPIYWLHLVWYTLICPLICL